MVRYALLCLLLLTQIKAKPAGVKPTGAKRSAPKSKTGGSLLAGLSLHDRIAQMIVVRGYGDYPSRNNPEYRRFLRWIEEDHVGGFIVAGRIRNGNVIPAQPYEMVTFINQMQRLAKTPLLVASDFERGASMRVANTAQFPYQMAFGAAHDVHAVTQLGEATAREARALGVQWVFAPDADVNNNPDNPIINVRSFGEDPAAVAADVAAFVDGAHRDKDRYVLVTAKHFPGHGDTAEDSHMQLAKLDQPKERIESLELVPFRAAVQHGVDAVMTAHLSVPAFEPQGLPATLSPNVLTGLLRDELHFDGLVVTDALEMQGIAAQYSQGEAAVKAVEAGADVLLMPTDPEPCIKALMRAVGDGHITRERIDRSALRIMAAKKRTGLLRNRLVDVNGLTDELEGASTDQLAQQVADRAVTLVKDDKHQFPYVATANTCLVIMGEYTFTQRGEMLANELRREIKDLKLYLVNPSIADPVLDAIATDASHCGQIYAAAFVTVAANRGSVGLEGGLSRFLHTLEDGSVPLALISLGNPYLLRDFPKVSAYAATFSSTQTSEIAAAQAILGKIAIEGKLPVSIPPIAKLGDGLTVPARAHMASNGLE